MRLNTLRLSNFRQHADTLIEFDTGLTGIIGPNGAGKSTILEAIAWALYGMTAARGTRESIRWNRAGARSTVKVELDFELGGHRYVVTRGLTSAELCVDGSSVPIANSITGVTDLLRRHLGMSLDEFFNTYFTGQKELSIMAAMGPSERAQFLSRVLGYDKLRTAQRLVRDHLKMLKAEAEGVRSGMRDADAVARMVADAELRERTARQKAREAAESRDLARSRLEAIVPRWETMQQKRVALQQVESERRVAEGEQRSLQRDVDRLNQDLSDIARSREEMARLRGELAPLAELVPQLREMDQRLSEEGKRRAFVATERELAGDLERLAERRARLDTAPAMEAEIGLELERGRHEIEAAEASWEAARTEWVRDRQEAETKKAELLKQYHELRHQRDHIVALGEEGICPTCSRPLGTHFRTVLDLLDSQTETVQVDGKYYKARLEQLEQMPAGVAELEAQRRQLVESVGKAERRLAKVQVGIQELAQVTNELALKSRRLETLRRELESLPADYDEARHQELRAQVARLQPLEARCARLSAQVEREEPLTAERALALESAARVRAKLDALDRQRRDVDVAEHVYNALRAEHEEAAGRFREAELFAVAADGELAGAAAAWTRAQEERAALARAQSHLDRLTRDKRLHDELDRAYSSLRDDLNEQLRPEISELASAFLADLTDARYSELELDDDYNIIVLEDGVPKPVISGGEEDIANLVLRLAISQMIAERAGQAFSLLILDEIFGSLDDARRHNVVQLLLRLQDRFEQVIVITHIEDLRELDRVISVRFDEATGTARVEQERPRDPAEQIEAEMHAGAAD